ncbi:deoxyribodipyrimidine photo-lyase [Stappia sp. ES.058]|uniref:cryptochrome/photolyase family protein n=1 Tax=Stappia sp. ES.058 TaxID=1881061 RepID=UPI000879660A|nr:deoxyribodipyrimidine photo-lyase [Stappia sp. ES.058]SDU01508.1 deoxyribodipyrimidine photo-lyase type I [Stappia sp. ES.058]
MDDKDFSAATVVWFRNDLRIDDNPALTAALETGAPVFALYVLDDETPDLRSLGAASRWWLHHSLTALRGDLEELGIALVLRRGAAADVVADVVRESGSARIVWNRRYDPGGVAADKQIKAELKRRGVETASFNAALLVEPWEVKTGSGEAYKVFTPFWRAARALGPPQAPGARPSPAGKPTANRDGLPHSDRLEDWALLPTRPDWTGGLRETWRPGEAGALARLETFLCDRLADYAGHRDEPGAAVTSMLSPHLRFGEISPRRIWAAAEHRADDGRTAVGDTTLAKFQAELGWREFSHHLLFHFPSLPRDNFQPKFDAFPWRDDTAGFRAWTRGQTGYPLVDAGMRELWHTGYMHNRVRMVVGSFLVKHLMIDWRDGEAWFWDTLVDADAANNTAGWQWIAGSGADAAPYFRIFNPTTQGEKFDKAGDYTRRWVPELAKLPDKYLFKPHEAPASVLADAGVRLDTTYPRPVVDHGKARQRALDAFQSIKNAA